MNRNRQPRWLAPVLVLALTLAGPASAAVSLSCACCDAPAGELAEAMDCCAPPAPVPDLGNAPDCCVTDDGSEARCGDAIGTCCSDRLDRAEASHAVLPVPETSPAFDGFSQDPAPSLTGGTRELSPPTAEPAPPARLHLLHAVFLR